MDTTGQYVPPKQHIYGFSLTFLRSYRKYQLVVGTVLRVQICFTGRRDNIIIQEFDIED